MRKQHWINLEALTRFVLNAQDEHGGGISDRPDDMVDVFHTFFGVASLALMEYPGLKRVDAAFALPQDVIDALGVGVL